MTVSFPNENTAKRAYEELIKLLRREYKYSKEVGGVTIGGRPFDSLEGAEEYIGEVKRMLKKRTGEERVIALISRTEDGKFYVDIHYGGRIVLSIYGRPTFREIQRNIKLIGRVIDITGDISCTSDLVLDVYKLLVEKYSGKILSSGTLKTAQEDYNRYLSRIEEIEKEIEEGRGEDIGVLKIIRDP